MWVLTCLFLYYTASKPLASSFAVKLGWWTSCFQHLAYFSALHTSKHGQRMIRHSLNCILQLIYLEHFSYIITKIWHVFLASFVPYICAKKESNCTSIQHVPKWKVKFVYVQYFIATAFVLSKTHCIPVITTAPACDCPLQYQFFVTKFKLRYGVSPCDSTVLLAPCKLRTTFGSLLSGLWMHAFVCNYRFHMAASIWHKIPIKMRQTAFQKTMVLGVNCTALSEYSLFINSTTLPTPQQGKGSAIFNLSVPI